MGIDEIDENSIVDQPSEYGKEIWAYDENECGVGEGQEEYEGQENESQSYGTDREDDESTIYGKQWVNDEQAISETSSADINDDDEDLMITKIELEPDIEKLEVKNKESRNVILLVYLMYPLL